MAENPILAKIKKLDEERSKLLSEAKDVALATATAAVDDLNSLGFQYRLMEGAARAVTGEGSRKGTRTVRDEPCPICKFKTAPIHDRRSHRTQEPKAPFTAAELAAKGLKKL